MIKIFCRLLSSSKMIRIFPQELARRRILESTDDPASTMTIYLSSSWKATIELERESEIPRRTYLLRGGDRHQTRRNETKQNETERIYD